MPIFNESSWRSIGAIAGAIAAIVGLIKACESTSSEKKDSPNVEVKIPPLAELSVKRIRITEDFTLGEKGSFVSKQGVTVKVEDIFEREGHGVLANIGASAEGVVNYLDSYSKGAQIPLSRKDCDSIFVVIQDIELSWPSAISREDLLKMGPGAAAFITRKVTGTVSGKCEQ